MGETISTLVFRPPSPTPIRADKFFYIHVPNVRKRGYQCTSTYCGAIPHYDDMYDDHADDDDNNNNSDNNNNNNNGYGDNEDECTGTNNDHTNHGAQSRIHRNSKNKDNLMEEEEEYYIPAFFLRRKGAKVTILFSHGNAEDLGMMYRRMKDMAMIFCANILAYDYTGYGLSKPTHISPSEAMCYRNIEAAYHHLTQVMKIPSNEIILYGRSLGSGPSCHLAKKTAVEGESVAGLILHSPFLSIYRIVLDCRLNLVGDMFINRSKAKDIQCPVLIIHGTKDDVVPFWHGDELLRSFPPQCRAQPFWVEGLGHNHIETRRREEYITRINNFIQSYVLPNVALNVQHTLQEQNQQPRRYTKQPMVVQEWEQYKPETTLKQSGKFLVNQTWVKHGRDIVNDAIKERNGKPSSTNEHSSKTAKTKTNATSTATATIPNQKILKREESNTLSTLKLQTPTKLHRRSNSDAIRRASATSKQKSKSPEKSPQQKAIDLARMNTEDLLKMANKNRASSSLKTSGSNTSHAYKLSRSESNQSIESNASRYILTRESWTDDDDDLDVSFDEKENINRSNKETGVSIQTFQSAEKKESNAVVNKAGKNDYYFKSRSVDRYSVDDSVHL